MREIAPASFPQQRIWFLEQLEPGHTAYNFSEALRLEGALDYKALQQSFTEIVRRHEVLRTTFTAIEGNPVQRINAVEPCRLPLLDVGHVAEQRRMQEAQHLLDEAAQAPFDLEQGPLFRPLIVRFAPQDHMLLITVHHITLDGWSMGLVTRELSVLYNAFSKGEPSPLSEPPIQYADYTVWQREWLKDDTLERQLNYWKQKLSGAPALLEFPTQRPRPARQSHRGQTLGFAFSRALLERLHGLCRAEGVTLFMLLMSAFQVMLCRYTGQEDLVVGSLIANRTHVEIENLLGFFVNTLIMRTDLSGKPTFREVLKRVRNVTLEAYDHQDVPYEQVVEAMQPERNLSYNPLFQVMFILQSGLDETMKLGDMKVTAIPVKNDTTPFDIVFDMAEIPTGLRISLRYNTDIFDQDMMEPLVEHFRILLENIVTQPEACIWDLELLTPTERQHHLSASVPPTLEPFPDSGVLSRFAAQVRLTPHALAVCDRQETMSYAQLDGCVNRLAQQLRQAGVGLETPVAVLLERGCSLLATLLALFKVGATYLPLDPLQPASRLQRILARAGSPLLLTQAKLLPKAQQALELFVPGPAPDLVLLEPWLLLEPLANFPEAVCLPEQLAYLLFTSGSTGEPKGVMVTHKGMFNHLCCKVQDLTLTSADRVAQTASQCFDISLWQLLAGLLVGACIHILPDEISHDPHELLLHLEQDRLSVLQVVPSMLAALLDELEGLREARQELPALRWLISTGEALPPALCRRWLACYPHIPLLNAYGPTEASDDVTHACIKIPPTAERASMPIGSALSNTRLYVLGRYGELLPPGVHGELYVGGPGVARGYLGESARTAEVFVPDAYSAEPGARLYRTGDIVCWRDEQLEFVGRRDQQIKLRGFRIELGEIEAALRAQAGVNTAVVLLREGPAGEPRLVAYLLAEPEHELSLEQVRQQMQGRLPEYMQPSAWVLLDELPLTSNGKIDQKRLPLPQWEYQGAEQEYEVPRDAVEEVLAGIWSQVLGQEPISIQADFFELGGHSLLATRLLAQVRATLQVEVPLRALFETPTIAGLADFMRQTEGEQLEETAQMLLTLMHLSDEEVSALLNEEALAEGSDNAISALPDKEAFVEGNEG